MEASEVIEITGLPIEYWSFQIEYDHWVQIVGPKNWVCWPVGPAIVKSPPVEMFEKMREAWNNYG